MKTLAIDASTKSSGIAIFQNKELLGATCITASSSDLIKRIHKMVDTIDNIVKESNIDKIVMEEVIPDHTKNTNTFKALMWLQASIIIMLHDKYPKIEVTLVYPGSWRSQCGIKVGRGIKRESLKEADIHRANELFNLNTKSDDIADACLIGAAHVGIFGAPPKPEDNEINWE